MYETRRRPARREREVEHLVRSCGEALALLYRGAPGYEARLRPGSALVLSGEPCADLNAVVLGAERDPERRLAEDLAVVRARRLPVVVLLVPRAVSRLNGAAERLGLTRAGSFPLMVHRWREPIASARRYRVERVTDGAALEVANDLGSRAAAVPPDAYCRAFSAPLLDGAGVDVFVAYRDGVPVSTVQTTRAADTVGLWAMGTPAEHQRRGAGRELLASVLAHHAERGVRRFYLASTAAGRRLYESVGFRPIAELEVWSIGTSTQVAS